MKPILPLLLRRSLLASLLVPIISLSFSASAADFMVDASQYSDPNNNIYSTLEELVSSVALVAGDTVILNNDDASLTTGLTVPVNFRSADPAALCAVDLSGLGKNPLYNLGAGEYTLEMDSVIWSNGAAGVIRTADDNVSLEITGEVQFLNNHVDNSNNSAYGGAIDMEGDHATLTLGNNVTFSGNYASSDSYSISTSSGGAIYMQGVNSFLTICNGAIFTNNYSSTYGGAIYLQGITTDNSSRFLAFTHDVLFSGNMTGGTFTQHNDGSFSVVNGVANAIHVDGTNHLQLAAAQGKEVRFNDPITSAAYFSSTENVTLSLNQYTDDDGISHTTDGTVIFSGELYQGDDAHLVASRYSDFKGQTTLYGGSLILEHNVVFGNAGLRDDTSMTLELSLIHI